MSTPRREKKRKRKVHLSLAHIRSIEIDKIVRHRARTGAPVIEPAAYVQPLAHTYRRLLSEKGKTDDVNIGAVTQALYAWARVHRLSFAEDLTIPRAARTAVEHPRFLNRKLLGEQLKLSYEERRTLDIRSIRCFDKSQEECERLQREDRNQRRRAEYARERDRRGGLTRPEYLAKEKGRVKDWQLSGLPKATYYRHLASETGFSAAYKKERKKEELTHTDDNPVSRPPETAAQPSVSSCRAKAFSLRLRPTSTWVSAAPPSDSWMVTSWVSASVSAPTTLPISS